MALPSYLKKTSFGTWHFRIKVPKHLVSVLGQTEIRRSLDTKCEFTAARRAIVLAEEAKQFFQSKTCGSDAGEWLPRRHIIREKPAQSEKPIVEPGSITLSELIDVFTKKKVDDVAWTELEFHGNLKIYQDLLGLLGDRPLNQYTARDALEYRKILTQLPKRTSKKNAYRGRSLKEIVRMKSADVPTISYTTVNKYIGTVSSMFRWAKTTRFVDKNIFEGLQFSKKALKKAGVKRANRQRTKLSNKDISIILSALPMNELRPRKVSYPLDYWGPILAAFTGARASEIAQLDSQDIIKLHDIWCIQFVEGDMSADPNKKIKTENGERVVPIHKIILDCGFLDYVSEQPRKLFPQEKPVATKYGKRLSSDFQIFRKDFGLTDGQTFHGFRHSHATELHRNGYSASVISELQGREKGSSTTEGRYIKGYELRQRLEAINSVSYNNAAEYLPTWEQIKSRITFERVNSRFRHSKKKGGLRRSK